MECGRFENLLAEYASGELPRKLSAELETHLASCEHCRRELEEYRTVIGLIAGEPCLTPTSAESRELAYRLECIAPAGARSADRSAREMVTLLFASIAAFLVVAVVLGMQVFGRIELLSDRSPLGLIRVVAIAMVVMFVTSFIPILVTAHRRPLNGLTFRR